MRNEQIDYEETKTDAENQTLIRQQMQKNQQKTGTLRNLRSRSNQEVQHNTENFIKSTNERVQLSRNVLSTIRGLNTENRQASR